MDNWAKQLKDSGAQPTGAAIRNAATVALLRDGDNGLEVLMGKRATKMDFHGGAWVFPGGRIDDADWEDANDEVLHAARVAAAREAMEEAGVFVTPTGLVHFSNWLTPPISPKRFATWFFAGRAGADHADAKADGVESDAVRWFEPAEALAERHAGRIELAPPQFVTLLMLTAFENVEEALSTLHASDAIDFQPALLFRETGAVALYTDDIAYENHDLVDEPGPRHRLTMADTGWHYERD